MDGSKEAGVLRVMSLGIMSSVLPQASLAAILAMGKPVALDASAEERLQAGVRRGKRAAAAAKHLNKPLVTSHATGPAATFQGHPAARQGPHPPTYLTRGFISIMTMAPSAGLMAI